MTAAVPPDDVASAESPRPKRRRIPLLIVGVLVLALGAWAIQRYLHSRHHVSTDNAQVDGHITIIASRISAFVARVLVDDNQHVNAGDTLVVLDERDLRVRLEQAQAELRAAQTAVGGQGTAGQAQA